MGLLNMEIYGIYLPSRCKTPNPPYKPHLGRLHHEPVAEFTAPQDSKLHLTTFENSMFLQKRRKNLSSLVKH